MLPTRLNLLSPEKQKYLQKMIEIQFIKHVLELLLFVITITSIVLVGAEWVLNTYIQSLTANQSISGASMGTMNMDVRFINQTLEKTELIQNEYRPWTVALQEIASHTPSGVTLTSLHIDNKQRTLTVIGVAETRNDLLELEQELEKISWIDQTTIPLSHLTEKVNVSFSVTATMKKI